MLTTEEKNKIISVFAKSSNDTGSSEVQVALLSARIKQISAHLKQFPKDKHSRSGLLKLVGRRNIYLKYLKNKDAANFGPFVNSLKQKGLM